MYHILITIYGRMQLRRIDKEKLNQIEQELDIISGKLGAVESNDEFSYRLYNMPSGYEESSYAVLETTFNLERKLVEHQKSLYGYNIFILKSDHDHFDEWKKYLYLTIRDNSLWIQSSIKDEFKQWLESSDDHPLSMVKQIKPQEEAMTDLKERFLHQSHIERALQEVIESARQGRNQFFNLYGPLGFGKRESLRHYLKKYKGSKSAEYLWLNPSANRYNELESFKRALNKDLLQELSSQIDQQDHTILNRIKGIVRTLSSQNKEVLIADHLGYDMQILYAVYLKYYKRQMLDQDLYPIIIIEDIDRFTSHAQLLLLSIIEFCHKEKILIIYLTQNRLENLAEEAFYCEATADKARQTAAADHFTNNEARLGRANPYALMLFQWQRQESEDFYGDFSLHAVLRWTIKRLDVFSRRALYIVALCDGMTPFDLLLEQMTEAGSERIAILQRLKTFLDLQLIDNAAYPCLSYPDLTIILKESLAEEADEIYRKVAFSLYKTSSEGIYINLHFLFILLERAGFIDEGIQVLHRLFEQELNSRQHNLTLYFERNYFGKHTLSPDQKNQLNLILHTARLRQSMLQGQTSQTEELIRKNLPLAENHPVYNNYYLLERRRYYNATHQSHEKMASTKEILYNFQHAQERFGEALASVEMTTALFLQGQLRQAFDYAEIAGRLCEQIHYPYGMLLNLSIEITCCFAYGNLSMALRSAEKGIKLSVDCAMREKELFFHFARARAFFDCGYYDKSLTSISDALNIASIYNESKYQAVLQSWRGRCFTYLNRFEEALMIFKQNNHRENAFFLAECYYFMNDHAHAAETIKTAQNTEDAASLALSEKESWINGFDMIEGRLSYFFAEKSLLSKQIESFALFISGLVYNKEQALNGFDQLYSFNKITVDEPYGYLYSFYYSQLLDDQSERELKYTAENRAGRLLNTRASRFDDLRMQEDFLKKNYWNRLMGRSFR